MDTLAFAAARREIMDRSDDELTELVIEALDLYAQGQHDWFDDLVMAATVLFSEIFESETGREPDSNDIATYESAAVEALEKTTPPTDPPSDAQIERVTKWLTVFTVNNAMLAAFGTEGQVELQWVTMHDDDVRDIHVAANGQRRIAGQPFNIGGQPLHFPGEPVGPPHGWINCRCVLMRVPEVEMSAATTDPETLALAAASAPPEEEVVEVEEIDDDVPGWDEDEIDTDMVWHGVIAPTGVTSGDSRRFAVAALRTRDLPVPLRWQKVDMPGHDGSVVVANITRVWEEDGLIKAEGRFAVNAEADEVIALIADQMLRGVSVDLDDATVELQNEDGTQFDLDTPSDVRPVETIVDGRVASAALVSIPAFQEAFVALGPWEDEEEEGTLAAAGCAPCAAREIDDYYQSWSEYAVSEGAWDGSAARFTDEEWFRSTLVHRAGDSTLKSDNALPILEPNGDLNRAAVHAAAGRIDQTDGPPEAIASARKALIAAYAKLDEDPPESLVAAAFPPVEITEASAERAATLDAQIEAFAPGTKDGPGWVTNPKDTQRLRTYWTKGKGAAKIRWGVPGDFNRCRKQLAKYVPNPHYLAGTCSNLHKVALGVWPGQETGKHSIEGALVAAAFTVADIAPTHVPPADWFFADLDGPTPITITEDGRIYGHLAVFNTCHSGLGLSVGDGDVCTTAPRSPSGYAYFRTGSILTDDGEIAVGHITIGTGHAPGRMGAMPAAAHYDNTGSVAADVAAGEDAYGIWVAGAVRPGTDIVALRSATLSGDWRTIAAGLDLVGALAVNVPGFPIPRLQVSAAGGRPTSLVAAGIVAPATVAEIELGALTVDSRAVAKEIFSELRQITARAKAREDLVARARAMRVARARERCANL